MGFSMNDQNEDPTLRSAIIRRFPGPGAWYGAIGFTRGAQRSFLPETVLGIRRADGFYARAHPTGVARRGFPYVGVRDGEEVGWIVGIGDLGTIADAASTSLRDSTRCITRASDGAGRQPCPLGAATRRNSPATTRSWSRASAGLK